MSTHFLPLLTRLRTDHKGAHTKDRPGKCEAIHGSIDVPSHRRATIRHAVLSLSKGTDWDTVCVGTLAPDSPHLEAITSKDRLAAKGSEALSTPVNGCRTN